MTTPQPVEAKPVEALARQKPQTNAIAPQSLTPAQLLSIAVQEGADTQKLKELMDLQERWQKDQARQAYAAAIVAFRAKCPTIKRTGKADYGQGRAAYTYAQLPQAVEQIQTLMGDCQLAATWVTPQQTPTWIQVTCTVSHVLGHSETTTLGGPPDSKGGKNDLQAIKSTWTYLRRVTLFSLLGLVDKDELDDDGAGGKTTEPPKPQSPADPEAEAKTAFWELAKKKMGVEISRKQAGTIFLRVQEASGKQSAAECLAYLSREDVQVTKEGVVSAIVDEPASDLPSGDEPDFQTPAAADSDSPTSGADPTSTTPPQPPSYQCDKCLQVYPVKTANNKCLTKGCKGTVKPRK